MDKELARARRGKPPFLTALDGRMQKDRTIRLS
jgi:hypothetical protein